MLKIGIIGSKGRMGQAIATAAQEAGTEIAGGVDQGGDVSALAAISGVLIDFSSPAALEGNLVAAAVHGRPIVIGTTGLEERHHWLIDDAAADIAVLQTGNTSLGVNMLAFLVEEAARRLSDEWDIEIIEAHHRHKVDAPSGTALLLGQAAAKGRNIDLAGHSERGRDGITGARAKGAIGFSAVRGGSIAGDHDILFASDGETITLSHHAQDRRIFAHGAVKAALWLAKQEKGRYDMKGVLGL
ncbi:MAG: 4-hydroxy-tetrahydrodipicolinate reductase [Sphingomonadales bacterium]|nr:4-hydroxy-tetrahydrodipicolinate reductase [Sphingomonadales bacterium]